jgi:hypothetical protein
MANEYGYFFSESFTQTIDYQVKSSNFGGKTKKHYNEKCLNN